MTEEQIAELEEWFEEERNANLQCVREGARAVQYDRVNDRFHVTVWGDLRSTHMTLHEAVRAFEATPDPAPVKL